MAHVEQPVVRFIPDQSLTEEALTAAVEQVEDCVTKELQLADTPAGEFLQVVVLEGLGWNTALAEYKGDTSVFVPALLAVRRHLVSVMDPDRDNKLVSKAVQVDVVLYGDEQSSPVVLRRATGPGGPTGAAPAPERSTLLLQRHWGFISTHPETRKQHLIALATLAAEGWCKVSDGQTIELVNPGEPALEWPARLKPGSSKPSRPRTTTLAIYFKGTLTPPIAMQAGWGTLHPDGSRSVALSVKPNGEPLKLSFAPQSGGRGVVDLSAPGWRASKERDAMVRVEDFAAVARRSMKAPSRAQTLPSLADWRSTTLSKLPGPDQERFLMSEAKLSTSHGGRPVCPLFVHHDLSGSLSPACRVGGGCMLPSRPGFDPAVCYVPCMIGPPLPQLGSRGKGGGKPPAAVDGGGGMLPPSATAGRGGSGRGSTMAAGAWPASLGSAGGPIAGAYSSSMVGEQHGSMGPPKPVETPPSAMAVDPAPTEAVPQLRLSMPPPAPRPPAVELTAASAVELTAASSTSLDSAATMSAAEAETSKLEGAWCILKDRLASQWEALGRLQCPGMDPAERSSIYGKKAAAQEQELLKLPLGQERAMRALELWHEGQSRCKIASTNASARPSRADSEAGGSNRSRDSSAER